MTPSGRTIAARALMPGHASGSVLVLAEPVSFWGGVNPETGELIDTHHPQRGARIAGNVLILPGGRGSSSSSSVFAECIRNKVAPAALLLGSADPILALGSLVASEVYGISTPVVVLDEQAYSECCRATHLSIEADDEHAIIRFER
jgi:predicted aconitase with swiveling domain